MALADAQYIAINKALLAGQVSKSLVAKLYIGVAGEYEMAYGLISSIAGAQEVSTDLKKYIYDGVQFYKVGNQLRGCLLSPFTNMYVYE